MKNIKISIQNGLDEVAKVLKEEGFNVYEYGTAGLDADVTIITGVDEAYEEIQPAEYHANGKKPMLVIDGTNTTPEKILERVHQFYK